MVHNNIAVKIALKLLNSDSLEDCKKLIENIEEAYYENNEENFSSPLGHEKVINELKVLLEIYESLLVENATCKRECKFSFQSVLGIINNALKCPLSKNLEENLMQGIRCLHKITEITDSERCMKDLVEFYIENLEYIEVNHSCDDYKSKNINFRLEILCHMYSYSCSDSSNKFIVKFRTLAKNFKMKSSIEEYTFLSNLVFYGSIDVFKKTLHSVLPHLIKCSGDYEIIRRIWLNALNIIEFQSEENEDKLLRIFLTLCYLYDIAFKENVSVEKTALMKLIFGSEKFWKLIQIGLCNREMRKSALYIFKNTVLLLMKTEDCLVANRNDSMYVWWDSNVKNVVGPLYQKIVVILEYLDEKQVHLINPMLNMVEEAVEKILKKLSNDKYIEFSWIFLIYEHLLNHENAQVVKWGLKSFLKIPQCMYIDNMTVERSIELLIPILNNTHLYYNEGIAISENLREFFKNLSQNENCYLFFNTLMKSICNLTWSPEPLFFVIHALVNISNCHCLGEKEIRMIKLFIGKAFKTHNKTIRSATQNEFLNIILALTNPFKVSFDCLISLLSGFHGLGSLRRGNKAWEKVINWMISCDFVEKAETWVQCQWNKINDEFKEIDAKAMALTFMLCMDFYLNFKKLEKCELQNCFPIKIFSNMLKKFENCEKRVYYSEKVLNQILIVIFTILEENTICSTEKICPLSIRVLPVFTDILYYIKRELTKITYLEDFDTAMLHLKAFQSLTAFGLRNDSFDGYLSFLDEILGEISLDSIINENSHKFLSPLSFYCHMNLIKNLLECGTKASTRLIYFYLIKSVNECLEKEETKEDSTEKVTNFQTIWGTINSKFLETKWQILKILIIEFKMDKTSGQTPLPENSLLNLCVEGIHVGGYELLFPIMSVLTHVFQETENLKDGQILHLIWTNITERRKTDSFKSLVKGFVKMLFQSKLMSKKEYNNIYLKYVDLIFEDRSIGVVRAFMKHIQSLKIEMSDSNSVFCYVLLKALIFGPVMRKDDRLIVQVCDLIDSLNISEISDCDTSNEIRGRAVEMILSLDKTNLEHREFAWQVIGKLLVEEKNEKNIRYFGDSHVHRVKHRLMQALLLLEPMIDCQDSAKKVSDWLYNGLLSENNQPSIKYQQEWLLLRLLVRYPLLLDEFWARLNESGFAGIKAKGLCSLFVISYHLCKSVPPSATSLSINEAILAILPFSMDQQFEIRLYAQVILKKLYQLAIDKRLQCILAKFEITNASILKSIQRGYKGNSSKNCEKLEQDFYLNEFHPFEDYTLKTIFEDLPRLANVGSDEWISLKMFDRCGLSCDRATITLKNTTDSLEKIEYAKWCTESSAHSSIKTPEEDDNVISNYQKKIVPMKASDSEFYFLEPDFYHRSSGVMKKDGLVVVATLIDRIPNLGGLARTCEIFGVSEYILGSLKYAEDKQFVSLSVTAEKWLNIKEVKEQNLIEYVLDMKKNGYVVIGAEQALYSVSLNSVQFPKKSLLLLGNEKEGVPPNLLPLLDVCVEVPQLGIIRSLNVHVTGALFIWEYAKQNYFSIS